MSYSRRHFSINVFASFKVYKICIRTFGSFFCVNLFHLSRSFLIYPLDYCIQSINNMIYSEDPPCYQNHNQKENNKPQQIPYRHLWNRSQNTHNHSLFCPTSLSLNNFPFLSLHSNVDKKFQTQSLKYLFALLVYL